MKKTLVALAVLAASGASFAQVTISGALVTGYAAGTTGGATSATNADFGGLGVDTSEIYFTASEDLGGGMKATAKLGLAGADRSGESSAAGGVSNAAVTGRNSSLQLQTNAGILTLATTKAGDYLTGSGGLGVYWNGWDSKVFSPRTSRDTITYSLPVGAFTVHGTYQEGANTGLNIGAGTTGDAAVTGQSFTAVAVDYAAGKAKANFQYLMFNASTQATKNQTRLSGSYDLGAVVLGLGGVVTNSDLGTGGRATDLILGVKAPLGALSLGANFVQRKIDDVAFTKQGTGTISGTAIEAQYSLSKRTTVVANYARWTAVVGNEASNQYVLALAHSF